MGGEVARDGGGREGGGRDTVDGSKMAGSGAEFGGQIGWWTMEEGGAGSIKVSTYSRIGECCYIR